MRTKKSQIFAFMLVLIIMLNVVSVSAITGSMGNARMILYPEVNGWKNTVVEKSILVKNVNEVPIMVNLTADEDSKDFIEVIDSVVNLEPGEEYKAEFEVKVKKEGKYEGKINVFFTPADPESKEPGVVLSSTVIVIAKKDQGYDDSEEDLNSEDGEGVTGNVVDGEDHGDEKNNSKSGAGFLVSTLVVLLVALITLIYLGGKKRNPNKSKKKLKDNEK